MVSPGPGAAYCLNYTNSHTKKIVAMPGLDITSELRQTLPTYLASSLSPEIWMVLSFKEGKLRDTCSFRRKVERCD